MADFTDRIKLVFDAVTGDATSDIGKLKGATDEAQTGWSKLKGVAGDAIGKLAASPAAVAAAGVAIGKVAFDLASSFGEAALSAQNFATASGLAVEDASRWQEVAGDLGVSTETLEGAVNKMNIAASKGTLAQLGIDGANTNEKLLASLEHLNGITDATERARQGAAIFGKSWASLAPLVEESANLRDNLADVSDQKVIDQGEVEKARHFRDAIDGLVDRIDDLKNAVGAELIEPIADLADGLGNVADSINAVTDAIPGMPDAFGILTSPLRNVTDGFNTLTDSSLSLTDRARGLGQTITGAIPGPLGSWASGLFDVTSESDKAKQAAEEQAAAAEASAEAAQAAAEAYDAQQTALRGLTDATLASFNSQLGLADAADKTEDAIAKYTTASDAAAASNFGNKQANDELAEAQRSAEQAALGQAAAAAKLAEDQAKANGETLTAEQRNATLAGSLRTVAGTLAADSPLRQSLLAYADQIEKVPDNATTTFHADTSEAIRDISDLNAKITEVARSWEAKIKQGIANAQAAGASASSTRAITAPSSGGAVVGLRSGSAAPVLASAAPMLSGVAPSAPTVINLSVSVAPFANPPEIGRAIADYLDAFYRRSGSRRAAVA